VSQAPKPLNPQLSALDRFGAELRSWRERRGLSQAALARLVHVHPDLIAKVEKAVRRPARELAVDCDGQLRTGGALVGLWLIAAAERSRAGTVLPAPVPIGCVVRRPSETLIRLDAGRYTAADLAGLEYFSHIEVVCHCDGVYKGAYDSAYDGGRGDVVRFDIGIFARPGAHRVNRLAVSRCRLLDVAGLDLRVADVGVEAGTPVLNLEPYTSESGPRGKITQPAWAVRSG
jgi:tRNA (Thr-GGU) A37 N-methylase